MVENAEQQTVGDVRAFICQAEGLPETEVRLYAAGSPLDNDSFPLANLNTDAIDVNVALKGGKVHGSLSRAGKVKGQTPKVEKKGCLRTILHIHYQSAINIIFLKLAIL